MTFRKLAIANETWNATTKMTLEVRTSEGKKSIDYGELQELLIVYGDMDILKFGKKWVILWELS